MSVLKRMSRAVVFAPAAIAALVVIWFYFYAIGSAGVTQVNLYTEQPLSIDGIQESHFTTQDIQENVFLFPGEHVVARNRHGALEVEVYAVNQYRLDRICDRIRSYIHGTLRDLN